MSYYHQGGALNHLFFLNSRKVLDRGSVRVVYNELKCPVCHRMFRKPFGVRRHLREAHGNERRAVLAQTQFVYDSLRGRSYPALGTPAAVAATNRARNGGRRHAGSGGGGLGQRNKEPVRIRIRKSYQPTEIIDLVSGAYSPTICSLCLFGRKFYVATFAILILFVTINAVHYK